MKMAGGARVEDMNLQAFLQQAEEYESTGDAREGVIRILNMLNATHPFAVLRALGRIRRLRADPGRPVSEPRRRSPNLFRRRGEGRRGGVQAELRSLARPVVQVPA
jgi:hypothetical protein